MRSYIQSIQRLEWAGFVSELLQDEFGPDIDGLLQDYGQLKENKPEPKGDKPTSCEPDAEQEKGMLASALAKIKEAIQKSFGLQTSGGAHTYDGLDDRRKEGKLIPHDHEVMLINTLMRLVEQIVNSRKTPLRIMLDMKRKQCYFSKWDPKDSSNDGATEDALVITTDDDSAGEEEKDEVTDVPNSFGELLEDMGFGENPDEVQVAASETSSTSRPIDTPEDSDDDEDQQREPAENDTEKPGAKKDQAVTTETNDNPEAKDDALLNAAADTREGEETDLALDAGTIFNLEFDPSRIWDGPTTEDPTTDVSKPAPADAEKTATVVGEQKQTENASADPNVEKTQTESPKDTAAKDEQATSTKLPPKKKKSKAQLAREATEAKEAEKLKKRNEVVKKEEKAVARFLSMADFVTGPLIKHRDAQSDKPVKPSLGDQVLVDYMDNHNKTVQLNMGIPWVLDKFKGTKGGKKGEKQRVVMSPAKIRRLTWFSLPQWARELRQLVQANPRLFGLYTAALLAVVLFVLLMVGLLWWLRVLWLAAQAAQPSAAAAELSGLWLKTGDGRQFRVVEM